MSIYSDYSMSNYSDYSMSIYSDYSISNYSDYSMSIYSDYSMSNHSDYSMCIYSDYSMSNYSDYSISNYSDYSMSTYSDYIMSNYSDYSMSNLVANIPPNVTKLIDMLFNFWAQEFGISMTNKSKTTQNILSAANKDLFFCSQVLSKPKICFSFTCHLSIETIFCFYSPKIGHY